MKNVLVLFGSQSDEYIYSGLIKSLETKFKVDFEVISAHRNPKRLTERLGQDDFDFIVAGAGLAAHLPGVCASLTSKPIFGIPVSANFGGLDAFLSILQMPFGVPVGTVFPESIDSLLNLITEVKVKNTKKVNIVLSNDLDNHEYANAEYDRLKKYADEIGIEVSKSHSASGEIMNIVLIHTDYQLEILPNALYLPLMNQSEKNSPTTSLKVLDVAACGGVWFGVNNSRNALLFLSKFL